MKILFFHRWTGVREGGTETEVKNLARFMADRGHAVSILTLNGRALDDYDSRINVRFIKKFPGELFSSYHINDPHLYLYISFYLAQSLLILLFWYYVKKYRFDLISVHFFTEALVARLFRFLTGTPYIFVLEGYTRQEAKEARKANACLCISRYDQEQCVKDFGFKPILKEIGVDLKRFGLRNVIRRGELRELYTAEDSFLCLTVCRLEPRKDLPTLIRAAALVKKAKSDVKFLIVGEGISEVLLRDQVESSDLKDTVFFVGRVTDDQLPKYYQAADLFVLPTLYEGFGIVYLEALASGLPILSTKVGAVPEVIGEAGVLIEPRRPEILAREILRLAGDKKLREEISRRGLDRVRERYDQEKLLKIYEDSCLKLLDAGSSPA